MDRESGNDNYLFIFLELIDKRTFWAVFYSTFVVGVTVLLLTAAVLPGVATSFNEPSVLSEPGDTPPEPPLSDYSVERTDQSVDEDTSISNESTVGTVQLLTGQTVSVSTVDGQKEYTSTGDDPLNILRTERGTYAFPDGVDFQKFDIELFNVDRHLADYGENGSVDAVPVIVTEQLTRERTGETTPGVSAVFSESMEQTPAFTPERELSLLGGVSGKVTGENAETAYNTFRSTPTIEKVYYDAKVEVSLDNADNLVRGEETRQEYGLDGTGVVVAVADTGIDENHPDLEGRVVAARDFTGEGTTEDIHGHGSHVAGIVGGDGSASNGAYVGVAPNVTFMNARVLNSGGSGSYSGIIEGVEWADKNGADIISMSLGGTPQSPDPMREPFNRVIKNGTTIIVAAGNSGSSYNTIGSPGVLENVLTVGATDDEDNIADFSSRGPTEFTDNIKPDLSAPGVDVMSVDAGTDGYVEYSGTSMATPVVSGGAALLLEEHPDLTETQLRSALATTTDPLPYDANTAGTGRLNINSAIESDVFFDSPTVNFGLLKNEQTGSQVVNITNTGPDSETFTLEPNMVSSTGTEGSIAANVTRLTIPAGETRAVQLTTSARDLTPGYYSGHVVFDGDDRDYRINIGVRSEQAITFDITKSAVDGTSLQGDTIHLYNFDERALQTHTIDTDTESESIQLEVLADRSYAVVSGGENEATGERVLQSEFFETPQTNQTVDLDESETAPVYLSPASSMSRENLKALHMTARVFVHPDDAGWGGGFSYETTQDFPETTTVYVSRTDTEFTSSYLLGGESDYTQNTRHLDTDDVYHLMYKTTVSPYSTSKTYSPSTYSLAEHDITYFMPRLSDEPVLNYDTYYLSDPQTQRFNTGEWELRDRRTQTFHIDDSVDSTVYLPPRVRYQLTPADGSWSMYSPRENAEDATLRINAPPYKSYVNFNADVEDNEIDAQSNGPYSMGEAMTYMTLVDSDNFDIKWSLYKNSDEIYSGTSSERTIGDDYKTALSVGDTVRFVLDRDSSQYVDFGTREYTESFININSADGAVDETPRIGTFDLTTLQTNGEVRDGWNTIELDVYSGDVDENELETSLFYAPGDVESPIGGEGWTEVSAAYTGDPGAEYTADFNTESITTATIHVGYRFSEPDGDYVQTSIFNAYRVPNTADEPPTATVQANESEVAVGDTITFDSSSSTDDNGISRYEWDFGDGNTATGETVTHTFSDRGTFTPTVTVTDTSDQTSIASTVIVVKDMVPPEAVLTTDKTAVNPGEYLQLDASESTDNLGIGLYHWDPDGDGEIDFVTESQRPAVEISYTDEGTYDATVKVEDKDGNMDSDSVEIHVGQDTPPDTEPPTASLTAVPNTIETGESVNFDASASSDNTGIERYLWDYNGDGTVDETTDSATTSYTYTSVGNYTPTVTVEDATGNQGTATTTVTVEDTQTLGVEIDYVPEYTQQETVEVFANINQASGDIDVELQSNVETKTFTVSGQSYFYEPIALEHGENTVTVTVTDETGAVASDATTIISDSTGPEITDVSLSPYVEVLPESPMTASVSVIDTDSHVESVTADGQELTEQPDGTWVGELSAADTNGIHSVTIAATDSAGNTEYETILYLVGTPVRE